MVALLVEVAAWAALAATLLFVASSVALLVGEHDLTDARDADFTIEPDEATEPVEPRLLPVRFAAPTEPPPDDGSGHRPRRAAA